MRKRIVRLCLLAALLCLALGLNVNAATHSHTQCGGSSCTCGSGHTTKTWTAWNGTSNLYNSHYYHLPLQLL